MSKPVEIDGITMSLSRHSNGLFNDHPTPYSYAVERWSYMYPQQPYGQFQPMFGQQFQPQPAMPQQPMPSMQPSLLGRLVNSESEITASDVTMGAAPSWFPLADGSAIIAKQWANDGTIKTVRYSAEIEQPETPQVSLVDVLNQLDNIQDTLNAMQQAKPVKKKKGDDDD